MRLLRSGATGALAAFALWTLTAASAIAAPITVPTTLNPGDQYRLVYLCASCRVSATSTSINFYNNEVDFWGGIVGLVNEWRAIGSTATVDAIDNTGTTGTGVPIFTLNDTKVADNYLDFWDGSLDAAINVNEFGNLVAGGAFNVWTGTDTDGRRSDFDIYELGNNPVRYGNAFTTGSGWVQGGTASNSELFGLYGISELLTVPGTVPQVSAPAPLGLMALGLAGLAFARRSRVRRRT